MFCKGRTICDLKAVEHLPHHSPDHVEAACKQSLTDLNLDYLDMYLIHFPIR